METQGSKSPHTLFWIAGIAVTAFSAAGIAAIMGWIPSSSGSHGENVVVTKQPATTPAQPARARTAPAQVQLPAPARVAENAPAAIARCAECGVVESIREIEARGQGSGVGAVGGAVVGGVLGSQVGGGSGRTIATVAGAVGGAVAGNEIEKRVNSGKTYEITVRLEDGSSRMISAASAPAWRIGDRVKVINGVIESNS